MIYEPLVGVRGGAVDFPDEQGKNDTRVAARCCRRVGAQLTKLRL